MAIVVLSTTSWPRISKAAAQVSQAVASCARGHFVEVTVD
jgi:hypothetical protein